MKRIFKLTLVALLMIVSATALHAQQRVVIDGNNVCIRNSATVNANNKIGHENRGASFEYVGTYGSFYCINYHGYYGYVHMSYSHITGSKRASSSSSHGQKFAHITGNGVRIRTSPSYNGHVVGSCNKGEYLVFKGYYGEWIAVKFAGKTCYVHSDYANVY